MDLSGKTVFITGAAGGIGRAAVFAFGEAGAAVAATDVDGAAAEGVAAEAREFGATAFAATCDVTQAASVRQALAAVVERFGKLDLAFNNAGVELEASPTGVADEDVFDTIIGINLKGVFLCLKYELAQITAQGHGGAIVNTASVASLIGAPNMPAYAASKHGVIGLTKTAALEYARHGIRVNAICPGIVRTDMTKRAVERDPKREKWLEAAHPMNRMAEAAEVAAAALWLCSEGASFVTGQALAVDGGLVAR